MHHPLSWRTFTVLCVAGALSDSIQAETESAAVKQAWSYADLYSNSEGDYLKLSGRLQAEAIYYDGNQGDYDELRWRRFRFGFKGQYGRATFGLEADYDFNDGLSGSYNRLTDAFLAWKLSDRQKFTVLKQSAPFTLDGTTSSNKLYTPERNNLTNNLWFTSEYFTGVSLTGTTDQGWSYMAGLYSSDGNDEIGISDAAYFTLLSVGHEQENWRGLDRASFKLDFVHNEEDPNSDTRDFGDVLSLSGKFRLDRWDIWTDVAWGNGYMEQDDVWGLVLMPMYQATGKCSWVFRYNYLSSDGNNGLRLNKYESSVVNGRGDEYHEVFTGANYFFNDHKFKLQLGLQYTDMKDNAKDGGAYSGWGITGALRIHW